MIEKSIQYIQREIDILPTVQELDEREYDLGRQEVTAFNFSGHLMTILV